MNYKYAGIGGKPSYDNAYEFIMKNTGRVMAPNPNNWRLGQQLMFANSQLGNLRDREEDEMELAKHADQFRYQYGL